MTARCAKRATALMGECHLIACRAHFAGGYQGIDMSRRMVIRPFGGDEADRAKMFLEFHADHGGER